MWIWSILKFWKSCVFIICIKFLHNLKCRSIWLYLIIPVLSTCACNCSTFNRATCMWCIIWLWNFLVVCMFPKTSWCFHFFSIPVIACNYATLLFVSFLIPCVLFGHFVSKLWYYASWDISHISKHPYRLYLLMYMLFPSFMEICSRRMEIWKLLANNLDVEQNSFLLHHYVVEERLWEIDIYQDPDIVAEREFLHYSINHQ